MSFESTPAQAWSEVAAIHAQAIHHGVMPLLGQGFMRRIYRETARAPRAAVWVAMDDGHVVGFLAGCADLNTVYRSYLRKGLLPLCWAAGRSLLRLSVLKRIPSILLYPLRTGRAEAPVVNLPAKSDEPEGELLAIAVRPDRHGQGIGRRLVQAFEQMLSGPWGISRYVVTTDRNEIGSNAFYQAMGFELIGSLPHHSMVLQKYRKHLSQPVDHT